MKQKRYFTENEANALIPMLEQRFARILQMRAKLRGLYQTLEQHGETPTPESLLLQEGPRELVSARGKFRALMEALHSEVHAIDSQGVEIKDLDIGLCDFLALRNGREVYLCWQYGEKGVSFWHELTTGFAGRRPIEETETSPRFVH